MEEYLKIRDGMDKISTFSHRLRGKKKFYRVKNKSTKNKKKAKVWDAVT